MTQRLLTQFDVFEEYSQTILAKHAKDRNIRSTQVKKLLSPPLTFDFEFNNDPPSASVLKNASKIDHEEQNNLNTKSRSQSRLLKIPVKSPREIPTHKFTVRPFSAPHPLKMKDTLQPESKENTATLFTKLKLRPKSSNYTEECFKRTNWKTQVKDIPTLETLCEKENKLTVNSPADPTNISRWSAGAIIRRISDEESLTGEKEKLQKMYEEVGRLLSNHLKKDDKGLRRHSFKSRGTTPRDILFTDENSKHKANESLKRNVEPFKNAASEYKKEIVPLSIEDEMKKPDVRIIDIGHRGTDIPSQKSGEKQRSIYSNQANRFISFSQLNSVECSHFSKTNFLEKCKNERKKCRIPVGGPTAVMQHNLSYATRLIENKQKRLCTSAPVKRKTTKSLWSMKQKINIHILGADGTSKIIHWTTDEDTVPKHKSSDKSRHHETRANNASSKTISYSLLKQDLLGVGPILNGLNPDAEFSREVASSRSTDMAPVPRMPASCSSTCPHFKKSDEMEHTAKWKYISITKPLTTPRWEEYLFSRSKAPGNYVIPQENTTLGQPAGSKTLTASSESRNATGDSDLAGKFTGNKLHQSSSRPTSREKDSEESTALGNTFAGNNTLNKNNILIEKEKEETGTEPLQICSINKCSIVPLLVENPGLVFKSIETESELGNDMNQIIEDMRKVNTDVRLDHGSSLPVINIPTGQNEDCEEFETERTK